MKVPYCSHEGVAYKVVGRAHEGQDWLRVEGRKTVHKPKTKRISLE